MKNQTAWFEIPVKDIERAATFYSGIFRFQLRIQRTGSSLMGSFSADGYACTGNLISTEGHQLTDSGVLACLSGWNDLSTILGRVQDAGGEVVVPKTMITTEIGYVGVFLDTEGNRLALHSLG